jgi:hypothetical protein
MDDLVKRLRKSRHILQSAQRASISTKGLGFGFGHAKLCQEAADRISELEAEVERLVRINKSFGAEIKRLRKLKGEPDNWSPTLDKGDE